MVTVPARRLTRRRLRILGYHGVPDADRFAAHVRELVDHWVPVGEDDVIAAIGGGPPLPERAVWVTFDDGEPSTVANALPVLADARVPATMYVCPGSIDRRSPHWWRVLEWADRTGAGDHVDTGSLARREWGVRVGDGRRRAVVADLSDRYRLEVGDWPREWRQLGLGELRRWIDAGLSIGNHSWDHPCLDRCSPDLQRRQVRAAHDWLCDRLGLRPRTFAYPNGNHAPHAERELAALGYDAAVLYGHRLARADAHPLRLQRLHIDATDSVGKLRAVVSGAQPPVAHARRRLADRWRAVVSLVRSNADQAADAPARAW